MNIRLCLALTVAIASMTVEANQPRSASAKSEFKRQQPCPATGQPRGPCPGYVVDHIVPLCAGGADHPSNMQWQTVDDAKAKDREERKICKKGAVDRE